jgi:hypothetical protein
VRKKEKGMLEWRTYFWVDVTKITW